MQINSKEKIIEHFKNNNGVINIDFLYPTDFATSKRWLLQFLKDRFDEFGPYEDAILKEESNTLKIMLEKKNPFFSI